MQELLEVALFGLDAQVSQDIIVQMVCFIFCFLFRRRDTSLGPFIVYSGPFFYRLGRLSAMPGNLCVKGPCLCVRHLWVPLHPTWLHFKSHSRFH